MKQVKGDDMGKLVSKYGGRINKEFGEPMPPQSPKIISKEYEDFRDEMIPKNFTIYEKACKHFEVVKIGISPKRLHELNEYIRIAHLKVTPYGVESFGIFAPLIFAVVMSALSFLVGSPFFAMFFLFGGIGMIFPLRQYPKLLANRWRIQASNQMVLCIFYMVTYMRHTSNLEGAINFAANHLSPPLSLELKKVVWDVETEVYDSVKDSLEAYLENWRAYNMEFIEAMHLLISSLYEPSEEARISLLDKSLDVILSETFEKMMHYAQNLRSPITVMYLLGVILPILGLVILPLVVSFMGDVKWYHLACLYNIILPGMIYYLGTNILATRPTGYGAANVEDINPEFAKLRFLDKKILGKNVRITPKFAMVTIFILFSLLALTPVIAGFVIDREALLAEEDVIENSGMKILEYRTKQDDNSVLIGPFGLGASMISLLAPLGIGLAIGSYFWIRSRKLKKIRDTTKELDDEFASSLFQLGSRIGDGLPAEMAFGEVAYAMEGSKSAKFFQLVATNVRRLGMGIKDAIFDKKSGAILFFPSNLITSSMQVLIQSTRKGPKVCSTALLNISRYIKEIHRVDERLKDLLAETISSMKSQINFLAPVISGVVIGITSMITNILGKLRLQAESVTGGGSAAAQGANIAAVTQLFGDSIPTYYFQMVVGIYVVQLIYILTYIVVGVEHGDDPLEFEYEEAMHMFKSTSIYCIVAMIVMLIFNIIAGQVLSKTGGLGGLG